MTVWYTADHHFGHARIIELCRRPYPDVTAMNEALVDAWNERVQPDDMVWVLGDVALGKLDQTLALVGRLAGRKYLVPGNHDRCWPGHRRVRPSDIQRYLDAGFERVCPAQVVGPDTGWLLCHLPPTGDSHDTDRFTRMRPVPAPGQPVIHGHVHHRWRTRDNCVNVGVDVWNYAPVREDEVAQVIAGSAPETPAQ